MGLIANRSITNVDYNKLFTLLRQKMFVADMDGDYKTSNAVAAQIKSTKIPFSTLLSLDPENIIFYLNYNERMAIKGLSERSSVDRQTLLNKITQAKLNTEADKLEYVNFIAWSCLGVYSEDDMCKIIKHFCDCIDIHDSNKLLEVYSVVSTTVMFKCIKILKQKREELKIKKANARKI